MPPPVRILLVGLAGVALLAPGIGVGAVLGSPPGTTPVETNPPPDVPPATEPGVTVEDPPGSDSITLQVPPLPDPPAAAAKTKKKKVAPTRPPVRTVRPARVHRVTERETSSSVDVAPVAESETAVKPKPKQKAKVKRSARKVVVLPRASASQRPNRELLPTHGVLAAQYSGPTVASTATSSSPVLYLGVSFAVVLGMLFGLVGAAPRLAGRWPEVFVPVIDATERIVLVGVCLAGAALTLAVTWALTGPGA